MVIVQAAAAKPEQHAPQHVAFLVSDEKRQHEQRHQREQHLIIVEALALGVKQRVEHHHQHDEQRAPRPDDAPRDEIKRRQRHERHHARERVGRPVGSGKHRIPDAGDPAGHRRMAAVAAEEALSPRIGFGRVDEDVHRGLHAGEEEHAGETKQRDRGQRRARVALVEPRREPRLQRAPAVHEESAAARSSSNFRSRAFCVSAAARSNSARASSLRPSFLRKSPRTLGSR